MKQIRKLFFQNSAGARRGMNGENGIYATDLAGFGFSLEASFADIGHGFFPTVGDPSEPQNPLAFTVVLTRDAYETHQSLVDWLAAAGTLTIVYNPTGKKEFLRDVTVNFLQKGEKNQLGWLELICSFNCTTPWYQPQPIFLSASGSGIDESMRYEYVYDDDLRYGSDSSAAISAIIAGYGHIPGALQLQFRGAVTNPQLRLVGRVSGNVYGICKLSVVLASTDSLVYCSRYENSYVKRIAADGTETDLLDSLDLSLTPYFHIPVNEPCELLIESDAPFSGQADVQIYYYYRSV